MSEAHESHGRASFTLLLALVTVVIAAAAFSALRQGRQARQAEPVESGRYLGLTPAEGVQVATLLRKEPAAFVASLGKVDSPRSALLLTHVLVSLPSPTDPRIRPLAEHLSRRFSAPERERLLRAYLESLSGDPAARRSAKTHLLSYALAHSLPARGLDLPR